MNTTYHYMRITFSGLAYTRYPHYLLLIAGQSGPIAPFLVSFSGSGGYSDIAGVQISRIADGVTVDGFSIIIYQHIEDGWGEVSLFNLIPDDEVTFSMSYED